MANNDQNLSFSVKMPYKVRCMIPECGKAIQQVYRVSLDGHSINMCSNDHARLGITRWQDKKARGITPSSPQERPNEIEQTGDNLEELEGE